nr:MAG: maturation protein [Sanya fiers-like virus 18]
MAGWSSNGLEVMGTRMSTSTDRYGNTSSSSEPVLSYSESWTKLSNNTPGFGSHMRFGLPFNKYGYTKTQTESWKGSIEWGWAGNDPWSGKTAITGTISPFYELWGSYSSFEEQMAIDEAVGKALSRVKDQSANWAENIATSKQSVSMISGMMLRVLNAYRAARQGNMAKAAAHLGVSLRGPARIRNQSKAIANGWLELQYGWLPLLSDIYQTTIAIQKRSQAESAFNPCVCYNLSEIRYRTEYVVI